MDCNTAAAATPQCVLAPLILLLIFSSQLTSNTRIRGLKQNSKTKRILEPGRLFGSLSPPLHSICHRATGRPSLSLTLARGEAESLAWKMLCLAVSLVIVNITETGSAYKLPPADTCITTGPKPNLFTGLQIQFLRRDFSLTGMKKGAYTLFTTVKK